MLKQPLKVIVTTLGMAGAAQAGLQAVDAGPYTAATGFFPLYYTDTDPGTATADNPSTTLDLCLSKATSSRAGGLMCTLAAVPGVFDPTQPIVFPVNFPNELFYFTADAHVLGQGIDLKYIAHLEAFFNNTTNANSVAQPAPGDQVTFARVRITGDIVTDIQAPGTYRVTHPYGVQDFSVATAGTTRIKFTRDIGFGAPGVFTGALGGDIGPFLRSVNGPYSETNPDTGEVETFIGDPNLSEPVTGSPFTDADGNRQNYVRVQRLDSFGIDVITRDFMLSGRIWNGRRPTPVTLERATYSRTAAGTQIDLFAGSTATASVCFRETLALVPGTPPSPCMPQRTDPATGTIIATGDMTPDAHGRFYGRDPQPAAVPPYLVATATDTGTTPSVVARALTDVVDIRRAEYVKDQKKLVITASSSDQVNIPKLRALGFDKLSLVSGTFNQIFTSSSPVEEPPATVTVKSSAGGQDTEPVTVVATAPVNGNPIANADSATTAEDTAVIIPVLANDTDPDNNSLTVTAVSNVVNGTAVINGDGSITFSPEPNFNGTGSFSYTVDDGKGGTASASVTVAVTPVNDPPVAIDDTATTVANTAVTIPVLANDSDVDGDALNVTGVSSVVNGTALVHADGTVAFTPASGFNGSTSFNYAVSDGHGGTATGTVTVIVNPGVLYTVKSFTVTGRVKPGQNVAISVNVQNTSSVVRSVPATVVGRRGGVEVYRRTQSVSDAPGGGSTVNGFTPYTTPSGQTGTIAWDVLVSDEDGDPTNDVATASTTVR